MLQIIHTGLLILLFPQLEAVIMSHQHLNVFQQLSLQLSLSGVDSEISMQGGNSRSHF